VMVVLSRRGLADRKNAEAGQQTCGGGRTTWAAPADSDPNRRICVAEGDPDATDQMNML
jgi:hypothetical protein